MSNLLKINNEKIDIVSRLKQIRQSIHLGSGDFARGAGIDPRNYSSIETGKRTVGERVLRDICDAYDINMNWLLTGEGEMLKNATDKPESNVDMSAAIPVEVIPLLPISAQGGTLNDFVVAVKDSDCERVVSPVRGADFAITVSGDSMAPEYPSGSQVIIKKINERAFIDWGKVYVLDTCNGVVIKRLMPADDGDALKVKCVSINPAYPPFEVNLQDVYGVYRVMLCMSMK